MIYVVFVLLYITDASGTIAQAVIIDATVRKRVARTVEYNRLPEPPSFQGYLFFYGLLWPLTIWHVLYGIWQEYTGREV